MARRTPPADDVSWSERFAAALLGALAGAIAFVSIEVFRSRRSFDLGMLGWYVGIGAVIGAVGGARIARRLLDDSAVEMNWDFAIYVLPAVIAVVVLVLISMT